MHESLSLKSESLVMKDLKELHLVHEILELSGPSVSEDVKVLEVFLVELDSFKGVSSLLSFLSDLIDGRRKSRGGGSSGRKNSVGNEVVHDLINSGLDILISSLEEELGLLRGLVRIRDTSEARDDSSSSLLIKSLNISRFTHFQRSGNMSLEELESVLLVDVSNEISISGVGGDEGGEGDLSALVEELGDLSDSSDVLSSIFSREAEVLVKSLTNHISVKEED